MSNLVYKIIQKQILFAVIALATGVVLAVKNILLASVPFILFVYLSISVVILIWKSKRNDSLCNVEAVCTAEEQESNILNQKIVTYRFICKETETAEDFVLFLENRKKGEFRIGGTYDMVFNQSGSFRGVFTAATLLFYEFIPGKPKNIDREG